MESHNAPNRVFLRSVAMVAVMTFVPLITLCKAQDGAGPGCSQSTVEDLGDPVYAAQARQFLTELQQIVKTDDRTRLSLVVKYPVHVSQGGRQIEVATAADLIQRYPSIVTPQMKQVIVAQSSKCLFANYQGVMIGDGEVWFQTQSDGQMKIVTFNVSSGQVSSGGRTSTIERNQPSVTGYFGTWRVERFTHLGGSAVLTETRAGSQVGKTVTLASGSARFDKDFLWTSTPFCDNASYSWAKNDQFGGHGSQALLPEDHAEKRTGDLLFLDVNCDKSIKFGCEVTNQGECAAYYDGYFFFLKRNGTPPPH